ncbi:MAG: family serine peptidase, partial [Solirubrobacterales bacterium]|nr:family serine peptidase [Solirubrobacterales bacterium]
KQDGQGPAATTARAAIARTARVAGPLEPRLRLVTVRPVAGAGAHATAVALRALPQVATVEVEHRHSLRLVPDDPALSTAEPALGTPPGTVVEWWAARQNLPAMWDITRGGGATVAVIDTGIDGTHPELAPKITGAIDNDSSTDHGGATTDEVGHGTHVASLACAGAGNAMGMAGAGLDCKLLVIKSDLSDSSVATSIIDAVDGGADAINMSFGTDGSQPAASPIVRAVDYAVAHGVILVAAAADEPTEEQGDPSNVLQPTGSGADVTQGKGLSVTAADFSDQRAPFAGLGSQISLAAYGAFGGGSGPRGIFGAFPQNLTDLERVTLTSTGCNCRTTFNADNRYAYIQGTSMAAPMVTAVAAVVRSLNPDLSAPDVIRVLKLTATRPAGTAWNPNLGWGILNGGAAAAAARVLDRRAPTSSIKAAARVVKGRSVTLTLKRADRAPPGCVPSGIRRVEVWRTANGGKARRIVTTAATSVRLPVKHGSRYTFFTIAVDLAGNRERGPSKPDTTVRGATG